MKKNEIEELARRLAKTTESYTNYVARLREEHQEKWEARYRRANRHGERKERTMMAAAAIPLAGLPMALAAGAGLIAATPAVVVASMTAGLVVGLGLVGKAMYQEAAMDLEKGALNRMRNPSDQELIAADKARMKSPASLWDKAMNTIRGDGPKEMSVEEVRRTQHRQMAG